MFLPARAAFCGEAAVKALSPSEIGEFATPDDSGEAYMFRPDPNGKYFHFEDFATQGCSVFCAIQYYEEEFSATSTLPQIKDIKYGPENLRNFSSDEIEGGSRENVWCEGVKGHGIGERVNMSIKLNAPFENQADVICFPALMIVNGHAKNNTTWKNNSRVKTLRLYVGGEPWCDLQLKDTIKPQIFTFSDGEKIYPAKSGRKISYPDIDKNSFSTYQTDFSFEILEVYPGAKYDDTCITGIAFDVYVQAH
jgi:hypothetical protein